jgi:tRNA 2-thiouridine synthesizing protein E
MDELECAGRKIQIDNEGFLVNQDDWNKNVAMELARREGFDILSDDQFEIIEFMRNYYRKNKAFPILNYVCKNIHEPRNCVNEEFIDPMKAWKISGLPKLDLVHFVSVDGKHYKMEECC